MEPDELKFEMSELLEKDSGAKEGIEEKPLSREGDYVEAYPSKRKRPGPFENESLDVKLYEPVGSYEGRHRFRPHFKWKPQEERRVVRKIDWCIFSWVCLLFLTLQLDRGNISHVLSEDMLHELGLASTEYTRGQTIYLTCFILAELPSQLISKHLGAHVWIPVQMIAWSLIGSLQTGLSGSTSFWTTRALIGICEAGFVPTIVVYLSQFYTSEELTIRLSYLWVVSQGANLVFTLAGYAMLHMSGLDSIPGWRWTYGLEGALTCAIGFISYLYLPPSPTQTASNVRGEKGWFTPREEKIIVNRVLRDDPSKGSMRNCEALSFRKVWQSLTDYHLWPIYLLGLTWELSTVPLGQYLTLNLRAIGLDTFEVNLLSAPTYTIWILNLILFTHLSEWLNERFYLGTASQVWISPMLMALEFLPAHRDRWVTYVQTMLGSAQPFMHAILMGLVSRNAGSVQNRTVSAALYNMCFQASHLIGLQIYQWDDRPYYFRGNKILILITIYNFFLFIAIKKFYLHVNRKRETTWSMMSKQEKEKYLATTKHEGNKRLDFRFQH